MDVQVQDFDEVDYRVNFAGVLWLHQTSNYCRLHSKLRIEMLYLYSVSIKYPARMSQKMKKSYIFFFSVFLSLQNFLSFRNHLNNMKSTDQIVISKLKRITIVSIFFMVIQILGGYYAHSIAILADAFHLLSDIFAYMISLFAVLMSHRQAANYLGFGYEKLQPLGALVNVAIIWVVTAQLFVEATSRILNYSVVEEPFYMFITSIFGLLCNLYIMRVLHSDEHAQGHHNCSHSHHIHSHANLANAINDKIGKEPHVHRQECSHEHTGSKKTNIHVKHQSCQHHHQHDHSRDYSDKHEHIHQSHSHKHDYNHKRDHQHELDGVIDHHIISPHKTEKTSSKESIESDECLGSCSHSQRNELCSEKLSEDNYIDKIDKQSEDQALTHQHHFQNINIEAAYIHILTDIILSIGVILSASIIYFKAPDGHQWTYWQLADPFCTYLFSIMALYSTIPIAKQSFYLLLDACHQPELINLVETQLAKNKSVKSFSELRVWSTNRGKHYGAVKIKTAVKLSHKEKDTISNIFLSKAIHSYIETEEEFSEKIN